MPGAVCLNAGNNEQVLSPNPEKKLLRSVLSFGEKRKNNSEKMASPS